MWGRWRTLRDSNPRPLDLKPAKWGHRKHPVTPNLLFLLDYSYRQFLDIFRVLDSQQFTVPSRHFNRLTSRFRSSSSQILDLPIWRVG